MEGVNDNASAFMHLNKKKIVMAKNYFLNLAESFTSENYVSQLHGNANKKTRKLRYFFRE